MTCQNDFISEIGTEAEEGTPKPYPFQPVEDLTPDRVSKVLEVIAAILDCNLRIYVRTHVHTLLQRQKQIDLGKSTAGYNNYCRIVPRYCFIL